MAYPEAQRLALRLQLDSLAETRAFYNNAFWRGDVGYGESCSEIRTRPPHTLLTNLASTITTP